MAKPEWSPEEVRRVVRAIKRALRNVDLEKAERTIERYKAAMRLKPGHDTHEAWSVVGDLTPRELGKIERYLPKAPGRPKGTRHAVTPELLAELESRTNNGEQPTPAAMAILKSTGIKAGLKGRADHLVRVWKREK